MQSVARPPISNVLYQHVAETASLRRMRSVLVTAPHVKLLHLGRLDERLAANIDGIAVGAEHGWEMCAAALEKPSPGVMFAAAVCAIGARAGEARDGRLERLIAVGAAVPHSCSGLLSAFGWLGTADLRGIVANLLDSSSERHRFIGIAACGMHRADPGLTTARRFEDRAALVRARAWRTAGEIGKRELVSTAAAAIADEDPACQFWAAWSAVLLGDRHKALEWLATIAAVPGAFRARAFQVVLQAQGTQAAHGWLAAVGRDLANLRWLIRGAGLIGDPKYIPWLISHMADLKTTRLAGESFSLITGLDLAWLDLEVKPPESFESGPNDDANDPNVDMDEDDGLPWPDVVKIQSWWHSNSDRFQTGTRYFMGAPVSRPHCIDVLKTGYQRQRVLAAHYLCLLNPGTPLFNTSAPAWRQQKLLAQMA